MYNEAAVEVFYPHALFDFCEDDLGATLSFLRDVVPREALGRWRRVKFTMTETQCEGWTDGEALACGYPPGYFQSFARRCWPNGGLRPGFDYKADWRAVLRFIAANMDLAELHVSMDMNACSWALVEDTLICDEVSYEWFRSSTILASTSQPQCAASFRDSAGCSFIWTRSRSWGRG